MLSVIFSLFFFKLSQTVFQSIFLIYYIFKWLVFLLYIFVYISNSLWKMSVSGFNRFYLFSKYIYLTFKTLFFNFCIWKFCIYWFYPAINFWKLWFNWIIFCSCALILSICLQKFIFSNTYLFIDRCQIFADFIAFQKKCIDISCL